MGGGPGPKSRDGASGTARGARMGEKEINRPCPPSSCGSSSSGSGRLAAGTKERIWIINDEKYDGKEGKSGQHPEKC